MRYLSSLLTLLAFALPLAACEDAEPEAGESGGRCRVTLVPCNAGLECRDNGCHPPGDSVPSPLSALFEMRRIPPDGELGPDDEGDGPRPPVVAEARASDLVMRADGRDRAGVRVTVLYRNSRGAARGSVRLWVDPPAAGLLGETLIELDENGQATTSFVACDKTDPACPWRATLHASDPDEVLTPIGSSTYIWLEGGNRPPPPDMGDGGSGGAGGEGGSVNPDGPEIPDGVVPWGRARGICGEENSWSPLGKPEGFILTGWNGTAQGGIKVDFTYVLASAPTQTLEGSYVLRGADTQGYHTLDPSSPKLEVTFDNATVQCTGGVVLASKIETSSGSTLKSIRFDLQAKCGSELAPMDGCIYLTDELAAP